MKLIIIIFFTCVNLYSVLGQCSKGFMGSSIGNFDWYLYRSDIKAQGHTGMCWSFATTAYLETMYYILTKNKYKLSVQQLSDNMYDFSQQNPQYGCDVQPRPAFNGGNAYCALKYVEHNGIMTEYDYPFVEGGEKYLYNASYITPIGVKSVRKICYEYDDVAEKLDCLRMSLYSGVVLANINGNIPEGVTIDIDEHTPTNHAVLITDICEQNGAYYVEFQNSWGELWGRGGFGYIYVGTNGGIYNNRQVLSGLFVADVYNTYTSGQALTISKDTYNTCTSQGQIIYISSIFLTSIMSLIFIILIVLLIITIINYRHVRKIL